MASTSATDDIRGAQPILTAKDVLIEVRDEVKLMRSSVDILISQDLDARVDTLERWQQRLIGLSWASGVLAFAGTALGVWNLVGTPR